MPRNFNNENGDKELAEMIDSLISGTISQLQFEELSRQLKADPAARQQYLAEIEIEANLRGLSPNQAKEQLFPSVKTKPAGGSMNWAIAGLVAFALVSTVGVITYQRLDSGASSQTAVAKVEDDIELNSAALVDADSNGTGATAESNGKMSIRSVARITNGQNLAWKTGGDVSIGSWLNPGSYELTSGNVEITLDSGAVVYIAAGSAFDLINSNEVRLLRGSLEADVPEQAIGFKVQTPSGAITDLSTKFGVKVSDKGESDVHVLKGLVEALPSGSSQKLVTLTENTALRMFPDSPPEPVKFSPKRLFEIGSRNNQSTLNFLHFSFDEKEVADGLLNNSGSGAKGHGGKIIDGDESNSWVQVEGPFGKSLFFSGEGAKIETKIKGIEGNRPRTLMFWVRINPETSIQSAYSFASWGLSEAGYSAGGQKWQIGWNPNFKSDNEGTMGAVRTEFGGGYVIGSTDLRDGRWHHIASVFLGGGKGDDVANLVRHYVDGKLESVSGFKAKKIMTNSNQRSLTIGDYVGAGQQTFTGYKGWIDEFYLFDKALTPSQIVKVMKQNKPPQAQEIVADQAE